jgi:hypothetical protein
MTFYWKKPALAMAALVAVAIYLAWILWPFAVSRFPEPYARFTIMHRMRREHPRLALVPQPLTDYSVNPADGMTFSRFGYEFEIPWKDVQRIDDREHSGFKDSVRIVFKSGYVVVFLDPNEQPNRVKENLKNFLTGMGAESRASVEPYLGGSNFDLESAILRTTSDHVSPSMPRSEVLRQLILLNQKLTETEICIDEDIGGKSRVYAVQTRTWRCFEKGEPARGTLVDLFDDKDREVQIHVMHETWVKVKTTQADVNRIVQTLRPVGAPGS